MFVDRKVYLFLKCSANTFYRLFLLFMVFPGFIDHIDWGYKVKIQKQVRLSLCFLLALKYYLSIIDLFVSILWLHFKFVEDIKIHSFSHKPGIGSECAFC